MIGRYSVDAEHQLLVFGTAQFSSGYGVMDRGGDRHSPQHMLQCAHEMGFSVVDTAPVYGEAEVQIGLSPASFGIHTKLDPSCRPYVSLAKSLKRLSTDHIDVLYVHDPAVVLDPDSGVLDEASALVGPEVSKIGVSIYDSLQFEAALHDPRVSVIQCPINLASREIQPSQLLLAAERGVEIYARSVFLQGVLLADPRSLPPGLQSFQSFLEDLDRLSGEWDISREAMCAGWVKSLPAISGVLLGAVRCEQLVDAVKVFRAGALPAELLRSLEDLSRPPSPAVDPRSWKSSGGGT